MQPTLLLSAPAVLSHKHSHSGAPPHPRPGSAGYHHWQGKGGLGDPDDSNEPRGLGVCTSRARPGHGTRPRQLVCWAGQCRSRYQHGLFSRAGDTEPVYQTCDTVLSTLATWAVVLRQPHNRVLQKRKFFVEPKVPLSHLPPAGARTGQTTRPVAWPGVPDTWPPARWEPWQLSPVLGAPE